MKLISSLFLILIFAITAQAQNQCKFIFTPSLIEDLAKLRIRLDTAQSQGRSSPTLTSLRHGFNQKEKEVIQFLKNERGLSADEIKEQIKKAIAEIQKNSNGLSEKEKKQKKEQEFRVSLQIGKRLQFNPVRHGDFLMGRGDHAVEVSLTKDFEMSAVPITQIIWKRIMLRALERFPEKYEFLKKNVNIERMSEDVFPVANITHGQTLKWIEALNDLAQEKDPLVAELIPNHRFGDVYRLPTDAEWEFVVRQRGANRDRYPFGQSRGQLDQYSWNKKNSEMKTHAVATREPIIVDGFKYYDLLGNVGEWVQDVYMPFPPGGINPLMVQENGRNNLRVVRGGSFFSDPQDLESSFRGQYVQYSSSSMIGFRLVRDLR